MSYKLTVDEKDRLVQTILDRLKHDLLYRVPKMPAEWDGFEISQFIADYYETNYLDRSKLTGKRKKDYKNACIVDNLL